MRGSIAFDRAADYYDETRGLSVDGVRRTTEALSEVFRGTGAILEVGVGTGQVAMPLAAAGVEVVGLDLSRPMLSKLVGKAGGAPPFPLVEGDAARMPFVDAAFGGAYLRWVLHLIPEWRAAVTEITRVVAPGAPFLAALGSYGGMRSEIQARFAEITGVSTEPVGLTWDGGDELDDLMGARGAHKEADITLAERDRDDLETFMRAVESNRFSWTWAVADDAVRADAAREARSWAEARLGPLERVPRETFEWTFVVYRLA